MPNGPERGARDAGPRQDRYLHRRLTDLLFYGDTERSAAMRHELPIPIVDPFLLGLVGGRMHVMSNHLERDRIRAAAPGDAVLHDIEELGFRELLERGMSWSELDLELASRAAAAMGVREALADPEMPVAVADRLRADGLALRVDAETVAARRRVKSDAELAGIRRAQAAAEAGMGAAADLLRRAEPDGDGLVLDGEVLTAEAVRDALRAACERAGAPAPPDVIVSSLRQGSGHDPGAGPLPANLPIVIDLWPRDESSACWADMARTFVVGEVGNAVRAQERLVREALEAARQAVRPGVTGRELHGAVCDLFEAAGHRTQRTGPGEEHANEGFQFSLGHGVGLQVHEEPSLGQSGLSELVAGDVIAVEPGLWQPDTGEVRFEDLLLVTEDGSETLTRFPYELSP
jgi:Xaa-Pro aminopeptidase